MCRESRGSVTSMKSHCISPRSTGTKTTPSENAVTLPRLSPQLQTRCTSTPALRDVSPLCHLAGSGTPPPHATAQPWGMLLHRRQRDILLFLSPYLIYHNFPTTHLQHIIPTASFHLLLVTTETTGHIEQTAMLTRYCNLYLSPNH